MRVEMYSGTMSEKALCSRLLKWALCSGISGRNCPSDCVEGKAVGQAEGSLVLGLLQLLDDDDD